MMSAQKNVELVVHLNQEPARQAELLGLAAFAGPAVLATRTFETHTGGTLLLLVTADTAETGRILAGAGFQFQTNPIVLCGPLEQAGLVARLGGAITAAGIGVLHSYSSWFEGRPGHVVFKTTDDDSAVRVATHWLRGGGFASADPGARRAASEPVLVHQAA